MIAAVQAYSIQNNIQYIGWRALARLPASMTPSYSLGEHIRNDVRADIRPPHHPVPYSSVTYVFRCTGIYDSIVAADTIT